MKMSREKKQIDITPKFTGRFTVDGGLNFGTYIRISLKKFIKENPNMPFELKPLLPESIKQRGFFEACLCPLVAFYQEGMDHRNLKDIQSVREWLKVEFNGTIIMIGGKSNKVGQSTKRKLNQGFLEKVIGYLEENYTPPVEALSPSFYKDWRDRVFAFGGPDNIIDYLISLNLLTKV